MDKDSTRARASEFTKMWGGGGGKGNSVLASFSKWIILCDI